MYVTDVNQSTGIKWSTVEQNNSGACSDMDGLANQQWIVANRNLNNYPAFQSCEKLDRHGHTDWYLPARQGELHDVLSPNSLVIGGFGGGGH